MASELISNIIIIAIAVGFAFSLRLSDVPKYLLYGAILTAVGAIGLLNYYGITALQIPKLPIVTYAVNIMAILVGGGLMKESIMERSVIKWPSFLLGVAIVVLAVVPTLYALNAITFNIPSYPEVVNYYLHVSAGILLLIGIAIIGR
ncbi:MAG: hypothetical protein AABX34_05845 [Nanoarchaeota archaeon]